MSLFSCRTDTHCYEKVSLNIKANNLPKLDSFSNTDPFAAVYIKDNRTNQLVLVAHTDVIKDTVNPEWPNELLLDYMFEERQEVAVKVFDKDGDDLSRPELHDLCGEVTFTMANLMCSAGQTFVSNLKGGRAKGQITVRAETASNTNDIFQCTFSGSKLANKDGLGISFFDKSDPFLTIARLREDNTWTRVWQNEKIDDNLSPTWPLSRIPMMTLCNGDIDRPLKIEIFDYDRDGTHDSMGIVNTSVRAMLQSPGQAMDVIEPDRKAKSSSYKNSGTLTWGLPLIEHHPSFLDFLKGGCEISLTVAIDFTGSNGDPHHSSSLHYIDPAGLALNEYQQAIRVIGGIVDEYDSDKRYSVLGFGASIGPNVSHCFQLPPSGGEEAFGIAGVEEAYTKTLSEVKLAGPTLLVPLLGTIRAKLARNPISQDRQKYNVLLVLADGILNDIDEVKEEIVKLSIFPISIIIIGIGRADFTDMHELDSDGGLLRSPSGSTAVRDIVQFVPFRQSAAAGVVQLAKEVLAEIPNQLLEYMRHMSIVPNPPSIAPPPPGYEEATTQTAPAAASTSTQEA